jgi:hypothetical protein
MPGVGAIMKTLTLWEPWASLVALGQKTIETRSWATKYRGPLAIHAAKKVSGDIVFTEPFYTALSPQADEGRIMFRGSCILAICNLVDCVEITAKFVDQLSAQELAFGDYTIGRVAWLLEDVYPLAIPIPAKGHQRIWNWDETEHLVAIDPYSIGNTRICTPKGVLSGRKLDKQDEDAVMGLEVDA